MYIYTIYNCIYVKAWHYTNIYNSNPMSHVHSSFFFSCILTPQSNTVDLGTYYPQSIRSYLHGFQLHQAISSACWVQSSLFPCMDPTAASLKERGEIMLYIFLLDLSMYILLFHHYWEFLRAKIKSYTSMCLLKLSSTMPYPKFVTGNLWDEFYQHTCFI